MTPSQIDKTVEAMKKHTAKICRSKRRARKFLVDAGIYNIDGSLTKIYGGK